MKHLRETPFLDDALRRELWAILFLSPKNEHVIQLLVDKLHSPDDCGVRALAICILDHLNCGYVEQLAEQFKDDRSIYVQIEAARFLKDWAEGIARLTKISDQYGGDVGDTASCNLIGLQKIHVWDKKTDEG